MMNTCKRMMCEEPPRMRQLELCPDYGIYDDIDMLAASIAVHGGAEALHGSVITVGCYRYPLMMVLRDGSSVLMRNLDEQTPWEVLV